MKIYPFFYLFLLLITATSCQAQTTLVKSSDKHITYTGRINYTDSAAVLYWTGTSLKLNFDGTGVNATLADEGGENYYNVVVDGKVISVLHLQKGKKDYVLANRLTPGKHTLELWKRTEWNMGKTLFYSFLVNGKILKAPMLFKRTIEFFGNSITCGYAVEDTTGQDRGTAPYENGYISYAAITARHFNANYYCTAKSGIGVTISWFPLIMPEMYDRLKPDDEDSKYNFKSYTPDVVVINLFQNDSWLTARPEFEEYKARFGDKAPTADFIIDAYRKFVTSVRAKYPKAHIICALGNMDATKKGSVWPDYINTAVEQMHDKDIYTCIFPFKGTPGHPNPTEQKAMAKQLIEFIDEKIKW